MSVFGKEGDVAVCMISEGLGAVCFVGYTAYYRSSVSAMESLHVH
jgi:hypothetical protein